MSLPLIVYLANLFEAISAYIGLICIPWIIGAAIARFLCVTMFADGIFKNEYNSAITLARTWKIPAFVLLISCFIPSERVIYTMLAAHSVEQVAKNQDVQKLATNSLKLLEQTVSKYIEETAPKK